MLAREVVAPGTPGLAAVRETFGEGVLSSDGSLDRGALAAIVFSDSQALAQLNAITHPLIAQRSSALFAAAPEDAVVVYEIPLLAESSRVREWDLVVDSPKPMPGAAWLHRRIESRGSRWQM